MDLGALLATVVVSIGTVGGSLLVAQRFQKLGGGEAQEKLNKIRQEVADAAEDRVKQLEEQFAGCKNRLIEVEGTVETLKTEQTAERRRWGRERIDLKQEISDLHEELRKLRPNRRDARDRADD